MTLQPLKSDFINSPHGFYDRRGGVSDGVYASLNGGPGSDDVPEHVAENRRLVAHDIGVDRLLTLYQVHGADIVLTDNDWGDERPKADAMASNLPGYALTILTADCCPVLFEDPKAKVIGAAHAGWRGAVAGVTDSVVELMEKLGAARADIRAAIGPTISQTSYEVGCDMRDAAVRIDKSARAFFAVGKDDAHFQFDLPGYVESRLKSAGVQEIDMLATDTYSSDNHFSYRRATHRKEPDYGRQMSVICLS